MLFSFARSSSLPLSTPAFCAERQDSPQLPAFSCFDIRKYIYDEPSCLTFVDDPSPFPGVFPRRSWALVTAVEFALHIKRNGTSLAAHKRLVNCKQLGFARSAFMGYKHVNSNGKRPDRGKPVIVAASKNEELVVARRLHYEQKSDPLLRELAFCFSQTRNLVIDPFGGTFSRAMACFTVPRHRLSAGRKANLVCFRVA